jgi:hypothetical protein
MAAPMMRSVNRSISLAASICVDRWPGLHEVRQRCAEPCLRPKRPLSRKCPSFRCQALNYVLPDLLVS